VSEWLQSYPIIADIILELQGKYPLPNRRLSIMNNPKLRPNDIVATQSWVWQSMQYSIRNKDFKHAKKLLCTDELHPLQALALNDWQQLQENAVYRCSGNISRKADGTHFSLGLFPYVHFTAPIRRYIDIVVQRLFHAAIDKKMLPYTTEEINRICNYFNNVSKNAYLFRSACKELVLASILVNQNLVLFVELMIYVNTKWVLSCFELL
jgi:exoribonuclease R